MLSSLTHVQLQHWTLVSPLLRWQQSISAEFQEQHQIVLLVSQNPHPSSDPHNFQRLLLLLASNCVSYPTCIIARASFFHIWVGRLHALVAIAETQLLPFPNCWWCWLVMSLFASLLHLVASHCWNLLNLSCPKRKVSAYLSTVGNPWLFMRKCYKERKSLSWYIQWLIKVDWISWPDLFIS